MHVKMFHIYLELNIVLILRLKELCKLISDEYVTPTKIKKQSKN